MASKDELALEWATRADPADQRYQAVKTKLGVDDKDIQAYKWAADNQQDMRAVRVKNMLFDKIANATPSADVQGVKVNERLVIKNLIDKEPEVQAEYLKRKGYQTRIIDGEVEAKQPGDINFKKIDPSGFDKWDVTDVISDIGEAVFSSMAGTSTVVTGPGAIVAGPAAAAGASAAYEAGKQTIAKIAGVRDEMAAQPIVESGILGGLGEAGGRLVSAAFKGISKGLGLAGAAAGIQKKAGTEAIEAASKEIGATPTAGMLTDSPLVSTLEENIYRRKGTLGGMGLRKTIEANKKAAKKTAETIVADASSKTSYEIGQEVAENVSSQLAGRIQPAIDIYEKYDGVFRMARPKKTEVEYIFENVADKYPFNEKAQGLIAKFKQIAVGEGAGETAVKNLDQLKQLRTEIGAAMSEETNKRTKQALGDIYKELTNLRTNTILKYAKGESEEFFKQVERDIFAADKLYAEGMRDAKRLIGGDVGDRMAGGAMQTIEEFMRDTNKATLVKDILKIGNPERVEFFKKSYPDIFKQLREGAIADIAERASIKGEVDPAKLVKILKAIPKESRAMILGDAPEKKFQALRTYLDNIPSIQNPSGTAAALDNSKIYNLWNQGRAIMQSIGYDMASNPMMGKDMFAKAGKFFDKLGVKATEKFILQQQTEPSRLFVPGQSQPNFEKPLFMPAR